MRMAAETLGTCQENISQGEIEYYSCLECCVDHSELAHSKISTSPAR